MLSALLLYLGQYLSQDYNAPWWHSFNKQGWSTCAKNSYMSGIYRSVRERPDKIKQIGMARCQGATGYIDRIFASPFTSEVQICYNQNWWSSFDHKGWSTCRNGYFMTGLFRSAGQYLNNIEEAKCCRPKVAARRWGHCYNLNVWHSFDREGWSGCQHNYFMTGLYRSSCNQLYCLEEFKCCKMIIR